MLQQQVTYSLAIEKQDEGYVAYFPALQGCGTWGATYEEAINNAREALTVYLESLDALGKPFPAEEENDQPASLGITIRVPIIT
jgi:antitoxin HicB